MYFDGKNFLKGSKISKFSIPKKQTFLKTSLQPPEYIKSNETKTQKSDPIPDHYLHKNCHKKTGFVHRKSPATATI
jgi:hypothetical protein